MTLTTQYQLYQDSTLTTHNNITELQLWQHNISYVITELNFDSTLLVYNKAGPRQHRITYNRTQRWQHSFSYNRSQHW